MFQLHFKLEGNYPSNATATELPNHSTIARSMYIVWCPENSMQENIHALAPDILFHLKQVYQNSKWVNDIYHVCSFYGPGKKDCIENLKLRQSEYETGIYYFFVIGVVNSNFFAVEYKCMSDEFFCRHGLSFFKTLLKFSKLMQLF